MRALKIAAALLLALAGSVMATTYPPYFGGSPNIAAGTQAEFLSGTFCVAASSMSAGTCTVKLDGSVGSIVGLLYSGPQFTSIAASSTTAAANIATLFSNVNSTGSAVTIETNRALAAEALLAPITNAVLVNPALGTPASGVMTNVTGTAASLTAGHVTTNANLTGDVTSVGNAATLANIPVLAGTNLTGTAANLTAGHVTTNANLTGGVTSVGNAATVVTNANLTGSDVTSVGNAATLNVATAHTWTGAIGLTNVALTATGASGYIANVSSANLGGVFTGSISDTGPITATTGTFTATGTGYSITTSSGISVNGTNTAVIAPYFIGNGSLLTNLPSAGGGATLAGPNTFTGTNNYTAASVLISSGVVATSTGSCVNFNPASPVTITQTSFVAGAQVAQSSVTITVAGTRVRCEVNGSMSNATSGANSIISFAMDGSVSAFPNTSSSVGLAWVDEPAAGYPMNIGTARELTVTAGAHTFLLGMWSNAGTITWPATSSTGQFCCREVNAR